MTATDTEDYASIYRCTHRDLGAPAECGKPASRRIVAPNGWRGPRVCREHGNLVVAEYRDKFRQDWRLVPA